MSVCAASGAAKDNQFDIASPTFSNPLGPYYLAILVISIIASILLAITLVNQLRKPSPDDAKEKLGSIVHAAEKLSEIARQNRRTPAPEIRQPTPFEDPAPSGKQYSRPVPPKKDPPSIRNVDVQTFGASRPASSLGMDTAPTRMTSIPPPAAAGDPLVAAYLRASQSASASDREQFEIAFQVTRMTCSNQGEWKRNKYAVLQFRPDDFGWYLVTGRGGQFLAFPAFKKDLASLRDLFEGVFLYPPTETGPLRLSMAAELRPDGANFVLAAPGTLESDV
jgi:hypothetical protein